MTGPALALPTTLKNLFLGNSWMRPSRTQKKTRFICWFLRHDRDLSLGQQQQACQFITLDPSRKLRFLVPHSLPQTNCYSKEDPDTWQLTSYTNGLDSKICLCWQHTSIFRRDSKVVRGVVKESVMEIRYAHISQHSLKKKPCFQRTYCFLCWSYLFARSQNKAKILKKVKARGVLGRVPNSSCSQGQSPPPVWG